MKPLALALLVAALATVARGGDLVTTAKTAKAKKKTSTTKVITNADVKKSKGKVVENTAPAKPSDPQPTQTTMERYNADRAARAALEQKLAEANANVAALEKSLASIEQQYYEENDLDKRDRELTRRFAEVQAQLEAARTIRDALAQQLNPSNPQ